MKSQDERIHTGRVLLGKAIRARRVERDMSMRDVAAKTGLSYGTITSIEYGLMLASLNALDLIAQALDTTVRTLFTDVYPWDDATPPKID